MGEALAFLLTWTCHGVWLHGDARHSVDGSHASYGTDRVNPSVRRRLAAANAMTSPAIVLSTEERRVVHRAIEAHCVARAWWLGALNVRTNHVHCVIAAPATDPEKVMQECKSWATRRLRDHNPQRFAGAVWTRHGSTRYLWKRESIEHAMRYVVEAQDNPARWRDPTEP